MIIGVQEKNGDRLGQKVQLVIWKYRKYFQPPEKKRRVAVAVSRNGGLPLVIEILPGEKQTIQEATISLHDLLPGLPPEIRAEIFPPAESS